MLLFTYLSCSLLSYISNNLMSKEEGIKEENIKQFLFTLSPSFHSSHSTHHISTYTLWLHSVINVQKMRKR